MSDKFVMFEAKETTTDNFYLINLSEILWVNWFKGDDDECGLSICFKNADHSNVEVYGEQALVVYRVIEKALMGVA